MGVAYYDINFCDLLLLVVELSRNVSELLQGLVALLDSVLRGRAGVDLEAHTFGTSLLIDGSDWECVGFGTSSASILLIFSSLSLQSFFFSEGTFK